VFRVSSAKAADLRRFLRYAKSNGIDAETLARMPTRSLPGFAEISAGPAASATAPDLSQSYTGLAPRASETGQTGRKGQPMSKAGPFRPRQPSRTGKHDPPIHHLAQQPRLQRTAPLIIDRANVV
jgi:hypothetical protein